jgi:NADH-dependent peroxiredoxin subunit C
MKHEHEKNNCCYCPPLVGQKMSGFELEAFHNEKIEKHKLSDYKGKWMVLLFYPADFTFVCPTELGEAAEYYPEFKKLNAEILSVSTDSVYVHKAWHDSSKEIKKIKYPMLADPTGKLCKSLSVYLEDEGLSLRATVIVDPKGIIKVYDVHDNSVGRSVEEILRRLQASKFVSEHEGQVCPVNWKPGKKTLKPGLKLVGKI